jgi:hypothetical protein
LPVAVDEHGPEASEGAERSQAFRRARSRMGLREMPWKPQQPTCALQPPCGKIW